jgi:hypothetical protein
MRLLIIWALMAGALGFIIYHVVQFARSINNPASLVKRDGAKLRALIGPYLDKLIPFTDSEMELMSLDNNKTTKRNSRHTLVTGVFNSIYHEPLMAFAHKDYHGRQVSSLVVRTDDEEFFYISTEGDTQVYHNGQALGVITPDGNLLSPNRRQLLAHLSPEDILKLHPVTIGEREVGKVINPMMKDNISPRAFQFLEEMNQREKTLFLSLSLLSLVEETLLTK